MPPVARRFGLTPFRKRRLCHWRRRLRRRSISHALLCWQRQCCPCRRDFIENRQQQLLLDLREFVAIRSEDIHENLHIERIAANADETYGYTALLDLRMLFQLLPNR